MVAGLLQGMGQPYCPTGKLPTRITKHKTNKEHNKKCNHAADSNSPGEPTYGTEEPSMS